MDWRGFFCGRGKARTEGDVEGGGRGGGDQREEGREAGERKGERNVVALLTLGRGSAVAVLARCRLARETEPLKDL